jgi:hypothetical protein
MDYGRLLLMAVLSFVSMYGSEIDQMKAQLAELER